MDFKDLPPIVEDMLDMMVVIINYRDENRERKPMFVGELYDILEQIKEATTNENQVIEDAKGKYKKAMQADEKRFIPRGIIQLLEAIVRAENLGALGNWNDRFVTDITEIAKKRLNIIKGDGTLYGEKHRNTNQSLGTNFYEAILELDDPENNKAFIKKVGIDVPPTPETVKKIFERIFESEQCKKLENNEVVNLINQFRNDVKMLMAIKNGDPDSTIKLLEPFYKAFKNQLNNYCDNKLVKDLINDMEHSINAFLNYKNKNLLLGTEYIAPTQTSHMTTSNLNVINITLIIIKYFKENPDIAAARHIYTSLNDIYIDQRTNEPDDPEGLIKQLKNIINAGKGTMKLFDRQSKSSPEAYNKLCNAIKKLDIQNVTETDVHTFERLTGITRSTNNELPIPAPNPKSRSPS